MNIARTHMGSFILLVLLLVATVDAAHAYTLRGTVYGGSSALADATVTLNDAATLAQVGTATTDVKGIYSFTVNNGSYNLTITPPPGSIYSQSLVNGVAVSGADVTQNVVLVGKAVTLSGVVKGPTGAAASNIKVNVYDQTSSTLVGSVVTGTAGAYSMPLAAGTYKFSLYGGPYHTGVSSIPTPRGFYIENILTSVSITANTIRDFTLPFVTLSGKTTDSSTAGVANVAVNVPYKYWTSGSASYFCINDNGYTTSIAGGNYSATLLPYAGYSVTLVPPAGAGLAQTVVTPVSVTADTNRDFTVAPPVTLSGVVKGPTGAVASNIKVNVYEQTSSTLVGSVVTGAAGDYSMPLAAGTYKFSLYGGPYHTGVSSIPTPRGFYIENILTSVSITANTIRDFTLPFVTLSGKTTDNSAAGVANVAVNVPYKYWTSGSVSYFCINDNGYTTSIAGGNYSATLLPYAGYSVTLVPPAGAGLAQTVVTPVSVTADTTLDFALPPPLTLSGVVKGPGGAAASNIRVNVYDQASSTLAGSVVTGSTGAYSMPLAAGTYKFSLYGGPYHTAVSSIPTPRGFYLENVLTNVSITANTTRDFILPFVTLSGKTTDSNGVPVSNVTVNIPYKYWTSGSASYFCINDNGYTTSDSNGNYSVDLLPTGYAETILPPGGSGFATTTLSGVDVSRNLLQNIILNMPDTKAPAIISGPIVTAITDTTAVVEWQTSEPATGGVKYGTGNPPGTVAAETGYRTIHSRTITGLSPDTDYFVSAYASDAAGNGPTQSGVVSFRTKAAPDITPPFILEGPTVTTIGHNSATVAWRTNEPAQGSLSYGTTSSLGSTSAETAFATSHSTTITGLSPETEYFVQVSETDQAGNGPSKSAIVSFKTVAAPDIDTPVITEGPMAINVSDTGATIVWKTNEPATSGVSYNDGTAYGVVKDDTLTTSHSVSLTGLTASTTYSYTASSSDAAGNGPTLGKTKTFTTLATPDVTAPVIFEGPLIVNITHQSAVIRWQTDEPADSVIEYGTSPAFG